MGDHYDLTQAGLEEYNTRNALYDHHNHQIFHHQKQSSYAQSEGYHSYVSSSDSSSATPFLDRLRLESSMLLQKTIHCQETENSDRLDENNHNSCAESTSSTETLKWLGSVNDDSECDYAVEASAISESVSPSKLIAHSARVTTPKRYRSESILGQIKNVRDSNRKLNFNQHCSSDPSLCSAVERKEAALPSVQAYDQKHQEIKKLSNVPSFTTDTPASNKSISPAINDEKNTSTIASPHTYTRSSSCSSNEINMNASSCANARQLPLRTNYRLFPMNTYTEPLSKNTINFIPQEMKTCCPAFGRHDCNNTQSNKECISSQNQQCWQSVAELINDFERSTNQPAHQYTFLEPSKTHRVSNPALKAIQKTAVKSYFERQQLQNCQEQPKNIVDEEKAMLRPQSLRVPLNLTNASMQVRNSLPDNLNLPILPSTNKLKDVGTTFQASKNHLNMPIHALNQSSPEPPPPPPRSRSLMPTFMRRSSFEYKNTNHNINKATSHENLKEKYYPKIIECKKIPYNVSGIPAVPPPPPPRKLPTSLEPCSLPLVTHLTTIKKFERLPESPCRTQYYNFCNNTSAGKSTDYWAPERPPKNPNLRVPSPDLPPPPPEIDTNLSDEPLPPPPPEVLQTTNTELLPSGNSFINSSSKNITLDSSKSLIKLKGATKMPPEIPKKPAALKKVETEPVYPNNRKRTHNKMQMSETTRIENSKANINVICSVNNINYTKYEALPPPLLPKNSAANHRKDEFLPNNRCNTKSSYLPKQSFENSVLFNSDHGSYKLIPDTSDKNLTSNKRKNYEFLRNVVTTQVLPDVLPQDAKQELELCSTIQRAGGSLTMETEKPDDFNKFTSSSLSNNGKANNTTTEVSNASVDIMEYNVTSDTPLLPNKCEIVTNRHNSSHSTTGLQTVAACTYLNDNTILNNLDDDVHKKNWTENVEKCENNTIELPASPLDCASEINVDINNKFAALSIIGNESKEFKSHETSNPAERDCIQEEPIQQALPQSEGDIKLKTDYEILIQELLEMLPQHDKLQNILSPIEINTTKFAFDLFNPDITLNLKERQFCGTIPDENDRITNMESEIQCDKELDKMDLIKQKLVNLITTTNGMLKVLNREQSEISEEKTQNDNLGNSLLKKIGEKVLPFEKSKIENYIDDIGHITSLLSALSERLAKTEHSLNAIASNNSEKAQLNEKRDRIQDQLVEAKQLKELINRRGIYLKSLLEKNLTEKDYHDFNYFINMKAKLIIDIRNIALKIKLREEQLCALREALIQRSC